MAKSTPSGFQKPTAPAPRGGGSEPPELPVRIAGIDWRGIQKGDRIETSEIEEAYRFLYPDRAEIEASFQLKAVKDWIEKARESIGDPLVLRQEDYGLVALRDSDAIRYLDSQATAGIRKHRRHTRRLFTHVDADSLDQHDLDRLQANQARHALIASAADGARRQSVRLLREGRRLPTLLPPEV